jgi:F420-non-reducing hydrogenase small subunit
MPCSGCFGPPGRTRDYGAKILSALASIVGSKEDGEIVKILDSIPDPIGTFYRYSLPVSMLRRKKMEAVASEKK